MGKHLSGDPPRCVCIACTSRTKPFLQCRRLISNAASPDYDKACDYDGGDCCECTCEDGPVFTCGLPFNDCDDPLANCNSFVTSPSPSLGENSENSPADRPTQASTPSATSSAVIALVCGVSALTISLTTLWMRSRRARRVDSEENGGDDALVAVGAPSAFSSKTCIRGTQGKWIRRGGQLSAVVGLSPVCEARSVNIGPAAPVPPLFQQTSHGRKGPEAGASTDRAPPPRFEHTTAGQGIESVSNTCGKQMPVRTRCYVQGGGCRGAAALAISLCATQVAILSSAGD